LLAVRLGEMLGLDEEALTDVYYLALLRHIGCTTEAAISSSLLGDEIAMRGYFVTLELSSPLQIIGAMVRHIGEDKPFLQRSRMVLTALPNARTGQEVAVASCEVAQGLARQLGFGPATDRYLAQTFERWDGKGTPGTARGEEIKLPVRIVHLAED